MHELNIQSGCTNVRVKSHYNVSITTRETSSIESVVSTY
jgi:hypothetical protein